MIVKNTERGTHKMVWWTAIPAATRAIYQGTKWVKQIKKLKKGEGSTVTKVQSGTKVQKKSEIKPGAGKMNYPNRKKPMWERSAEQAEVKKDFASMDKTMVAIGAGTAAAAYSEHKKANKRKENRKRGSQIAHKKYLRGQ